MLRDRNARCSPVCRWLCVFADFVAMVGEYVGTTLFLLLALGGTNVANIPNNSVTGVTTEGQDGTAAAAVNVSQISDQQFNLSRKLSAHAVFLCVLIDLLPPLHFALFRILTCCERLDLLPVRWDRSTKHNVASPFADDVSFTITAMPSIHHPLLPSMVHSTLYHFQHRLPQLESRVVFSTPPSRSAWSWSEP